MNLSDLVAQDKAVYPGDSRIVVKGTGPLDAKVLIIGEAPGKKELQEGLPFMGQSGRILNDLLHKAGLDRKELRIENVFTRYVSKRKDKSGKQVYYIDKEKVFHPVQGFTALGQESVNELLCNIKEMPNLNLVIVMGECALQAISDFKGIGKWMCSILWSKKLGIKIIPSYHPAAILWGSATNKLYIKIALERAAAQKDFSEYRIPQPEFNIRPTLHEIFAYFALIREKKIAGFDIEVLRNRLSHVSFSVDKNNAISIPFLWENTNFYTDIEETQIMLEIVKILENPNILKIGQNLNFDNSFMLEHYNCVVSNFVDTMVAQKTMLPEYNMGLDNITRLYTDHPYYKEEGQWSRKGPPRNFTEFGQYSARDALICREVWPMYEENLSHINNLKTFYAQNDLIPIIGYMGLRGMRTDLQALEELAEAADRELTKFEKQIEETVGREINPNSPTQLIELFYGSKDKGNFGLKTRLQGKKPTTNEDALKTIGRLKGPAGKVAKIVGKHRTLAKLNGTYYKVDLKKIDGYYRYLSSYGAVTKMGRLSGKKRLDGYGGNPQNIPKAINIAFLADPGYLIFNVDLSQADARSVALVGNVRKMLNAFSLNQDLHSITGEAIFGIPADEIHSMDKDKIKCPLGSGNKTYRDWAKRAGHSLNFDLSARSFAKQYELPIKEANLIVNSYHNIAYPEIRDGYHKAVFDMLSNKGRTVNCFGRKMYFFEEGDELLKDGYASIAQSNTVDIINQWGLKPFFYNEEFRDVDLIRQVHDSINFQLPISLGVNKMYDLLLKMRSSLERKLWWENRFLVIPSDWSVGINLKDQTDLNLDDAEDTKNWLNAYMNETVKTNTDMSSIFEDDIENFEEAN